MEILLDGEVIVNKEILFKTLKEQINNTDFQGNNLDALWDALTYGNDKFIVTIKNKEELEKNLGDYLHRLLELFNDLDKTSVDVKIMFI